MAAMAGTNAGKSCASPGLSERFGDRNRRKSSADGASCLRVERRRACARVLSATTSGRMLPVPMGSLPVGSRRITF
jgi:hypothetical protein